MARVAIYTPNDTTGQRVLNRIIQSQNEAYEAGLPPPFWFWTYDPETEQNNASLLVERVNLERYIYYQERVRAGRRNETFPNYAFFTARIIITEEEDENAIRLIRELAQESPHVEEPERDDDDDDDDDDDEEETAEPTINETERTTAEDCPICLCELSAKVHKCQHCHRETCAECFKQWINTKAEYYVVGDGERIIDPASTRSRKITPCCGNPL
jgi:hypothetical protein